MADEPDNITLRYLRRLDEKMDRLAERVDDLSSEVRSMRTHMVAYAEDHARHDGGIASLRTRLDRVERRLDLQDDAS